MGAHWPELASMNAISGSRTARCIGSAT